MDIYTYIYILRRFVEWFLLTIAPCVYGGKSLDRLLLLLEFRTTTRIYGFRRSLVLFSRKGLFCRSTFVCVCVYDLIARGREKTRVVRLEIMLRFSSDFLRSRSTESFFTDTFPLVENNNRRRFDIQNLPTGDIFFQ